MIGSLGATPNLARTRYPSAALLAAIRESLATLDLASRVGPQAFCGDAMHPLEYVGIPAYRHAAAAFRVLPGMTTLGFYVRVESLPGGASAPSGNDRIRLRINGAVVAEWSLSLGVTLREAALPVLPAYSVAEAVWELYDVSGPSTKVWPKITIEDALVYPVAPIGAWPGVPTWTDTYDAANLAQLADAVDFLIAWAGRRTDPAFTGLLRLPGPQYVGHAFVGWRGGITAPTIAPSLRVSGDVWPGGGGNTEAIQLLVNGVVVDSVATPQTGGQQDWSLFAIIPAGVHTQLEVRHIRTAGSGPPCRWSVHRVWCQASMFAPLSLTAAPNAGLWSWADLKAALTSYGTAAQTIYNRMLTASPVWGQQRLFRRRYGLDAWQERVFEPWHPATVAGRAGEALLIRGAGATLHHGPITWGDLNEVGAYQWSRAQQTTLVSGDAPETTLTYLDGLGTLPPGTPYAVRAADLTYAAEIWRVGSDV